MVSCKCQDRTIYGSVGVMSSLSSNQVDENGKNCSVTLYKGLHESCGARAIVQPLAPPLLRFVLGLPSPFWVEFYNSKFLDFNYVPTKMKGFFRIRRYALIVNCTLK